MTLPTSPALEAEIERLVTRCRAYVDATGAIARIRRLQHEASTSRSRTSGGGGVVIFDMDDYRRRKDGPEPPEAA